MSEKTRIDKWLWAARFYKTRGQARDAIKGGKVQIEGHRVKPGRILAVGDRLIVRRGEEEFDIVVRDLAGRRLSATLAQEKYREDPASIARREAAAEQRRLAREARDGPERRPDKRERRRIIQFTRGK